jgi:hypothetical protein
LLSFTSVKRPKSSSCPTSAQPGNSNSSMHLKYQWCSTPHSQVDVKKKESDKGSLSGQFVYAIKLHQVIGRLHFHDYCEQARTMFGDIVSLDISTSFIDFIH